MKTLLIALLCLVGLDVIAQAPPILRNRYSTNADGVAVAVLSTTNGNVVLKYTNSGVAIVDKNGSDASAVRGVPSAPSVTVSNAAFNVSVAGDDVLINPGLYTNNNLLSVGRNYEYRNGAKQTYTQLGNDAGYGILDDRTVGSTTNTITFDKFVFQGWTNRTTNGAFSGNANTLGAITVTNSQSKLIVKGNTIEVSGIGPATGIVGVYNVNGTNSLLFSDINQIIDPYFGTTLSVSNSGFGGAVKTNLPPIGNGIWSADGDSFNHVKQIKVPQYGFYGFNNGVGGTNHWYLDSDQMIGKVYLSAGSSNYTLWASVKDLRANSYQSAVAWDNTGGKGYLIGERMTGGVGVLSSGFDYALSWVTEQKIAATNSFVRAILGSVWVNAMDYEDIGGAVTNGFYNEGAYLWIANGGDARINNGKGVTHKGGTTVVDNLHMDTSNTDSTNNNPFFVSTSGLTLHNAVAKAPASAYSLSANTAQTVTIEGVFTANTAISPSITLAGGTNHIVNLSAHSPAVFDSSVSAAGAMSVSGNITNANGSMAANLPVVTGSGTNLPTRLLTPADTTAQYTAHFSSGTYSFTATPALLFPGSPATFSLTATGTWLIFAGVNVKYNAATFPAGRTLDIKLRKTSGTPIDLSGSDTTVTIRTITTTTDEAGYFPIPPAIYSGNFGDVIQIWGNVSVLPTAGTIDADASYITAFQIN